MTTYQKEACWLDLTGTERPSMHQKLMWTFRKLRVACNSSHSRGNLGGLLRGDTIEVEV